jgi:hypothetical protein
MLKEIYLVIVGFVRISTVKALHKLISFCTFHILDLIWAKFSIKYLHVLLCRIYWFIQKLAHVMLFFSCGHKWNYSYTCLVQPHDVFKVQSVVATSEQYVKRTLLAVLYVSNTEWPMTCEITVPVLMCVMWRAVCKPLPCLCFTVDLVTLDDLWAEAMLESSQRIEQLAETFSQAQEQLSEPGPPVTLPPKLRQANCFTQSFVLMM